MTPSTMLALFTAMAVLAAMPSVSVLTVSTRTAANGFVHGALTALGIVVGDIVFVLIAVLGLAFLAETLDGWFLVVKYLGGAYLIYLGTSVWRARARGSELKGRDATSSLSSFMLGLSMTLADQKAILFYLGFFPAFVDLSRITVLDAAIIITITIVAVGGVKLLYAYLADGARSRIDARTQRAMNIAASVVLVAVGSFIVVTAS
jgi:threonine/homoserine/homoserine lactone efflux protein